MNGFYGGPKGQDLLLKRIFPTKVAMDADLNDSKSTILVGEYVLVSYGLEDSDSDTRSLAEREAAHKQIDVNAYGTAYNGQFFQKKANQYIFCADLTGGLPEIIFSAAVGNNGTNPSISEDSSSTPDSRKYTITLPQAKKVEVSAATVVTPSAGPSVADDGDVNTTKLHFSLPRAVGLTVGSQVINPAQAPSSSTVTDANGDKTVTLSLPRARKISVSSTTVNANVAPSVAQTEDAAGDVSITLSLPQGQVMAAPQVEELKPSAEITVALDSTNINAPFLKFGIPRTTGIVTGSYNLSSSATVNTVEGAGRGDTILDLTTGNTFIVDEDNPNVIAYKGCLKLAVPSVQTTVVNAYTDPSVEETVGSDNISWGLKFNLPKTPDFALVQKWIGSEAATQEPTTSQSGNTVTLTLTTQRGARIFPVSTEASSITGVPAAGDIKIVLSTGAIYKYNTSNQWVATSGSLRGPVGESLHLVATYNLTGEDTAEATYAYIESQYTDTISPNDLFTVNWNNDLSYWAYKDETGAWCRVRLTGNTASLIVNQWTDGTTKTYSTSYINTALDNAALTWGKFTDLI